MTWFYCMVACFAKSVPCRPALSEKDSPTGIPQMGHDPRWKDYLEEVKDRLFSSFYAEFL